MNRIRIWPHATLIVLLAVAIAAGAAVLWKKYERTAEAKALPNAARIERVEGQVGLNRSLDKAANGQWVEAKANMPISLGDRIYTRDNGQSEIAFTGRNFATIDANTSLDVLDLSNQHTQVALREGSALFDVGSLASNELFEVATPCGAVDLERPGVYQIAIENNGNASATALSGEAQLVGQSGSGVIEKGETLSVPCRGGSGVLSRVDERTTETAQQTQTTSGANTTTEQARERQMADLAREAARGNRTARQEMQELQRQQLEQQRAERVATQQAQGERVRQQMQTQQAQREAARQQMITAQQQRHAATQQRIESQRAQQAVQHSQQQQQVKPQTTPQRRERKPQAQYHPPQAQQRVSAPARPQQIPQPAAPKAAPEAVRQPRQAQPRAQPPAEGQKKPAAQPQPPAQKKKPSEGAASQAAQAAASPAEDKKGRGRHP